MVPQPSQAQPSVLLGPERQRTPKPLCSLPLTSVTADFVPCRATGRPESRDTRPFFCISVPHAPLRTGSPVPSTVPPLHSNTRTRASRGPSFHNSTRQAGLAGDHRRRHQLSHPLHDSTHESNILCSIASSAAGFPRHLVIAIVTDFHDAALGSSARAARTGSAQ
jgi:hypothetical protein